MFPLSFNDILFLRSQISSSFFYATSPSVIARVHQQMYINIYLKMKNFLVCKKHVTFCVYMYIYFFLLIVWVNAFQCRRAKKKAEWWKRRKIKKIKLVNRWMRDLRRFFLFVVLLRWYLTFMLTMYENLYTVVYTNIS